MKKNSGSAKPSKELKQILKVGEMFVQETYLRLQRQKNEMTTEQAQAKFESELRTGSIVKYSSRGDVTIYRKQ
jgi:hypothetical protein